MDDEPTAAAGPLRPGPTAGLRLAVAAWLWPRLLRHGPGPDSRAAGLWVLWRLRWDNRWRRGRADLARFESRRWSQNGEDGILAEILRRLDLETGTVVEIGAADGDENCTRALVEDGWRGVWLEADPAKVARAREVPGRVEVVEAMVSAGNVTALLDGAGVPSAPEVLVVDIDGPDHAVLTAVLADRRPAVVVAEYNAGLGGPSWWVRPEGRRGGWDGTAWFGVGLAALVDLLERAGYVLVGCDSRGVNAFFVGRSSAHRFDAGSARHHFVAPSYRLPFGHPWRARTSPPPSPSDDVVEIAVPWGRRRVRAGGIVRVPVVLRNRGRLALHSFGETTPLHLASRWAPAGDEPARRPETFRLRAGGRRLTLLRVEAPATPGEHVLELFAVQEGVCWMGGWPPTPLARVGVVVPAGDPVSGAAGRPGRS